MAITVKDILNEDQMLDLFIMIERGDTFGAVERYAKLLKIGWSASLTTILMQKYRDYLSN